MPGSPFALLLHGRLDGWERGLNYAGAPPASGWDVRPESGRASFLRFCAAHLIAHVVRPNSCDVFIHSWNPEIGPLMDSLYRPVASQHEKMATWQLRRDRAVPSQHLSMARALKLALTHGAYRLMMVARHDVLFYVDVDLAPFDRRLLHLPAWCAGQDALKPREIASLEPVCREAAPGAERPRYRYLGGSFAAAPIRLSRLHVALPGALRAEDEYDWAVLDCEQRRPRGGRQERRPRGGRHTEAFRAGCGGGAWAGPGVSGDLAADLAADSRRASLPCAGWFVAPPEAVAPFAALGADYQHARRALANLRRGVAKFPPHAHFFWAWVVRRSFNATSVRFAPLFEGTHFRLARHWRKGSGCFARVHPARADALARLRLDPPPAGAEESLAARQCPPDARNRGGLRVSCAWYSPLCESAAGPATLASERLAHRLMNATTRLPIRALHGNKMGGDAVRHRYGGEGERLAGVLLRHAQGQQ